MQMVDPIIKANGARNGKPTGHREVRLNFPQGFQSHLDAQHDDKTQQHGSTQ